MIVKKTEVVQHLARLNVGGLIGEAILHGALGSRAITTDKKLYVSASPVEGVEPLPDPVGVLDLKLLKDSIANLSDDDEGGVSVEFKENRIFIEEKNRPRVRLATGDVSLIGTKVNKENAEQWETAFEGIEGVPLPSSVVSGIKSNVRMLSAEALSLEVGEDSSMFLIGKRSSESHYAEVDLEKLSADEEYTLHLPVSVFTAVLDQVVDYTRTRFKVSGPDSIVAVDDGKFLYIVSPLVG